MALRPTVSRGLPLSSGNAPNRNYSRLSFNKQCRCHQREDPLRHPKPLRYSKLAVLPAADCAPGHISGAPNMRNEGSLSIRGSACTARQICKLKCYREIGVAPERKIPVRRPGSATMFRSQASNPVVADQWCLSKHHNGAKRSGSSSSNCGVLGSLPPGKLTRREGTSGFHPKSPAQHVAVFSAPGRLRLRTSGKLPREHLDLPFHRRPRRTTDSGTPLYGVPPGAQRSDQPGKLRVDSRGSLSRYCCERY